MRIGMSLLLTLALATAGATAQTARTLSGFDTLEGWTATPSDGVDVAISQDTPPGADGPCLRIDYNFAKGSGFCVVRHPFPIDLPENYEFAFRVRGEGKPNNFEFKLLDGSRHGGDATASGDDVWWVNRRAYTFPAEWQTVRYPLRKLSFAWGPSGGAALKKLGAVEFAIAAAQGGKGTVWIDTLTFRDLPPSKPYTGTPRGTASSKMCEMHVPENLFDADPTTAWESAADDQAPVYMVDFGEPREMGGLFIEWEEGHAPKSAVVSLSDDGATWTPAYELMSPDAERSFIPLPDAQARFLRIAFVPREKETGVGIARMSVQETGVTASANEFMRAVAAQYPRGGFPRYLSGEQSYWTILGIPGDTVKPTINQEGMVEVGKGLFSIEPFIVLGGAEGSRTLTWADGKHTQELPSDAIPMPVVRRDHGDLALAVSAYVDGTPAESVLHVCYEVTTTRPNAAGSLVLAVRPFQVLPPWHQLNIEGGVAQIAGLKRDGGDLIVNGANRIVAHTPPESVRLGTFDEAPCPPLASGGMSADAAEVTDASGRASGLMTFPFDVSPGKPARVWISVPLHGVAKPQGLENVGGDADATLKANARKSAGAWSGLLTKVRYQVPDSFKPWLAAYQAQLAYALLTIKGAALEPGARTYDRSWIRDGASLSQALLEAGHPQPVRAFIDWYAGFQYESGKVPCVVDDRGPDPVPENDSHGQFINAIVTYYRFTGDKEFLRSHLGHIKKAVEYIGALRDQRMTGEFASGDGVRQEPGKPPVPARAFMGLVPESISHEGYSAKPMHSYWDDFWVLRGLKDAAFAAGVLGDDGLAKSWGTLRDEFGRSLKESISAAQRAHGVDYIPGCVELGDFDSTSTSIALWPVQAELPVDWYRKTMGKAWVNFVKRRDDPAYAWDAYTPYELRQVPAFLCLDERDKALDLMEWYLKSRRPAGWNHWAEVVWKDPAAPKFVGDMPHTWVGAEYMHAWRNMFAFERERDESLVLMAGVPAGWFQKEFKLPTAVVGLPTWYGPVNITAQLVNRQYVFSIEGGVKPPRGGIILKQPAEKPIKSATVNDQPAEINAAGEVVVREVPARVVITHF